MKCSVLQSGHSSVGFHAEKNLFLFRVRLDGPEGVQHPGFPLSADDAVRLESREDPQKADPQFRRNVDHFRDFPDLVFDVISGEVVSRALQTDSVFPEHLPDFADLLLCGSDLKRILLIVGNGELQQIQSESGRDPQLGFQGLLAESPGGKTVLHQRSLQSKRILKQSIPFRD